MLSGLNRSYSNCGSPLGAEIGRSWDTGTALEEPSSCWVLVGQIAQVGSI